MQATPNTVRIRLQQGSDASVDAVTVSTADDLLAAEPHLQVAALSAADQDALITYVRSIDATGLETAPGPNPPISGSDGFTATVSGSTVTLDWPDYAGGGGFTNYRIFRDTLPAPGSVDWWEVPSNYVESESPTAPTPTP